MTTEERESIVVEAIERALLLLPEAMAMLMLHQKNIRDLSEKFYKDNPEFVRQKELVGRTVEEVEGKNPGLPYEEVLKKASLKIRENIKQTATIDLTKIERPSQLKLPGSLGEL